MTSVLFLPKWYPNKQSPLEGIFIRRHAEAASAHAKVCVLFAVADPEMKKGFFYSERTVVNAHLIEDKWYYRKHFTGWEPIDKSLKLLLYFICIYKGYRALTRDHGKPQVIHVHILLRTGIAALFLSWLEKIPIVYSEHWSGYHPQDGNYKGWLRKRLTEFFISKTKYIMPVTQHLANAMQAHHLHGQYVIVPNVVDTDFFQAKTLEPPASLNKIALHISNFDPRAKNVSGILDVMKTLKEKGNKTQLWIIGDGEERTSLEKKAEKESLLNDSVFFLGSKMGIELLEFIQKADFLFMFSNFENQPCVIMEAMACGKPILATKVGGIPEMVNTERGILSSPENVKEMVQSFEDMLYCLPSFKGISIRQFVQENYSYSHVGQEMAEVYRNTLNG